MIAAAALLGLIFLGWLLGIVLTLAVWPAALIVINGGRRHA